VKNAKLFAGLLLACAVMYAQHPAVLAHVEQSDNGVSAVMHIYPDDNPIAGRMTDVGFAFGGRKQAFNVKTCGCKLTINNGVSDTSTVDIRAIKQDGLTGLAAVKFPTAGVYSLSLDGLTGKGPGSTFRLVYAVRVNPGNYSANAVVAAGINILLVCFSSLVILCMAGYYNIARGGRYTAVKAAAKKRSKPDDTEIL
jgi:hypothetical protein